MRSKEFLDRLDHDRISSAIAAAETKTSGEIRVFVHRGEVADDPLIAAQKEFAKLGMEKTAERNGVLIYVAPRARKLAVVGDRGVHEKCDAEFWQRMVDAMTAQFKREEFTPALVEAIQTAGALLAKYFPPNAADRNELSDEIVED